jgi:hypothetical protein
LAVKSVSAKKKVYLGARKRGKGTLVVHKPGFHAVKRVFYGAAGKKQQTVAASQYARVSFSSVI